MSRGVLFVFGGGDTGSWFIHFKMASGHYVILGTVVAVIVFTQDVYVNTIVVIVVAVFDVGAAVVAGSAV